ncbi:GRIP and coiled-coil domain-containing protein 2 [Discoglossus pictus]
MPKPKRATPAKGIQDHFPPRATQRPPLADSLSERSEDSDQEGRPKGPHQQLELSDKADTGQDGVSSPATPGTGKSKLDTLPKEDLIKFAKKQMMVIQKVKARCTELEKEIECLKSRPVTDGTDVMQALTERLDSVLLEKAETQQQLVALKKEYAKSKQEAQETTLKFTESQQHWEQSNNRLIKDIEALKDELLQMSIKHKEEVTSLKSELQCAVENQNSLTEKLSWQENQNLELKKQLEEIEQIRPVYEEQISKLQIDLKKVSEEKNQEIDKFKDSLAASCEQYTKETQSLHAELLKLTTLHQNEVSDLMQKNEDLTKESEQERVAMQVLLDQCVAKEKMLIEETEINNQKHENEIRLLRESLEASCNVFEVQNNTPLTTEHLQSLLTEMESQQIILKDELTYTNNVKVKFEMEVQHLKNEYFHEREELEFKINELQLAIEDYNGLIEKLKTQLQTTSDEYKRQKKQHSQEIQTMKEQYKRELSELNQAITSSSENEKSSFVCEIQLLKEQCNKLQQEKEDAVNSYENLRETMITLQNELGESAGKICKEFNAMKQQQATDVSELQQKLRAAYKDKNSLLETVNQLQAEAEVLSSKKTECEELQLQINTLQLKNEEVMASLQQKDEMLKGLEEKMNQTAMKNHEVLESIKSSNMEISKLQEMCKNEQARALELKQVADEQVKLNAELMQKLEEMTEKLQESVSNKEDSHSEHKDLQQQLETLVLEKQTLEIELKTSLEEILRLNEGKDIMSKEMDIVISEHKSCITLREDEKDLRIKLQQDADEQVKLNAELKRELEEINEKLQESICNKEQSHNQHVDLQQQLEVLLLGKQKLETELKICQEEIVRLNEERDITVKELNDLVSEHRGCVTLRGEEKGLRTQLQHNAEEQAKLTVELKQKLEEVTEKLQESISNKDQSNKQHTDLQQQLEELVLNKQKLEFELNTCHEEMLRLKEGKDIMTEELDSVMSEHRTCITLREELEELKIKLQVLTEDKEQVTKLLENEQQQVQMIKALVFALQETLSVENSEQDLICTLKAIIEALSRVNEEKQLVISQRDEISVQFRRLQEETDSQCAELRALISDYTKEKVLLKGELEETLADKEGLQGDLLEMKCALEKIKLENQDLLSHVEKLTADFENVEQQKEAQILLQSNQEVHKDSDIDSLTTELISVKDLLSSSKAVELEQQNCISELQNKIEKKEKEAKEKEEKFNKIKAVALKARKELDSSKKEVQSTREELDRVRAERDRLSSSMKAVVQGAEGYQNLLVEYERQEEQLETERDRANKTEHQLEELSRQLQAAAVEQEKLNSANEDFEARIDTLQSNNKLLEAQILEMQRTKSALDKELEAEKLLKEQKIKDHNCAMKQVEDLQTQLQSEKKQLLKTIQELELVKKDAQQSTLMDMEIADYERLVRELNQKITNQTSQMEDLEQEVRIQKQKQEMFQQEISSLQATVVQNEERSTKMKQLLVKTKKELADSKQAESDQLILQASLKGELEASQQQVEAYKIQVAELTSEKHKVQEQLRVLAEQQQRATHTYQQKLSALQEECDASKAEQATIASEFESYKVRVHNVLKQQKNKSVSQAEQEIFKQEREHLQTMLDQLKTKLQETQHNLQINSSELQTLQSEHDLLLERHNKMVQETVAKEAELREKLCKLQSENMVLKTEHAQTVSQLTTQSESQRNSYKEQVRHLQEDHRKTVETLQQQLSKVEAQLFQVKSEATVASSQQPLKSLRERRPTDLPLLDLYSVAREEGEGMEMTDTESVSSASTYVASLDQLLNSSDIRAEPPQWHPELSKEELAKKLNTTSKSVDHLSGLLHETEATNAILMEQITLLKNEIRRLERNQEREKSVANLEYLKNVLLQFIFLKAGSERQRLLPVIDTMLQLSPEEKGKLFTIAQGDEEAAARPAGWSSYLHSWSGLR